MEVGRWRVGRCEFSGMNAYPLIYSFTTRSINGQSYVTIVSQDIREVMITNGRFHTIMADESRPDLQDSVYIGDTHHGTVVHQQHIHQYPPQQYPVQTVVHHVYPQSETGNPAPESPRRQVWFLGRRIWNPQMGLITISMICSVVLIWMIPVLPAIIGIAIAVLAMKDGDIRGIIPITVGVLTLLISINTL